MFHHQAPMLRFVFKRGIRAGLVPASVALLLIAGPTRSEGSQKCTEDGPKPSIPSLEQVFSNPPSGARPLVWWHWMNGNITKQGISSDLKWMKSIGLGGVQNFDVDLGTPKVVDSRLLYMTPGWQDAFRYAVRTADCLGLEFGIAASPGWSETGGGWVPKDDGLKKVVWSEVFVDGGKPIRLTLPALPASPGPFQDLQIDDDAAIRVRDRDGVKTYSHGDIAVFAYPDKEPSSASLPTVISGSGEIIDASAIFDANVDTSVRVPRLVNGMPSELRFRYKDLTTIRSVTLYIPNGNGRWSGPNIQPYLEASDDGLNWHFLTNLKVSSVPETESFSPQTARQFRVVFKPIVAETFDPNSYAEGIIPPEPEHDDLPLEVVQLKLSPESVIDRFEAKAGYSIERDYFKLSSGGTEQAGLKPEEVVNITKYVAPDGALSWTPPAGRWKIVRIGWSLLGTVNHPAQDEATGLEVDKFDRGAVGRYMDHYLGMYQGVVGSQMFGSRGLRAIVTDSIEVGAANWTPAMIDQFKSLRGYDPTPWLPTLTGVIIGSRDQSDRFLYDYRRTLSDLMASEHYGTVAQRAHVAGLKVYGEALESFRPSLGDDMDMRRYADVPMAAMWMFPRETGPSASHIADIKGAASVAHIFGQNIVAAESMTSARRFWADSPATLRRIIDLEMVTGVNRPVIHTSVHQPLDNKVPGFGLLFFGQYFNRHETWATLARPWVDYISRSASLLQRGKFVADVAYFYGEEAPLTALYGSEPVADAPKNNGFDFVNPTVVCGELKVDGQDLVTKSGMRYKVLFLGGSSYRMSVPMLRCIKSLVLDGATVVGVAPLESTGLKFSESDFESLRKELWSGSILTKIGKGQVLDTSNVDDALKQLNVTPDFTYSSSAGIVKVDTLHRRDGNSNIWFVVNRLNKDARIEARFGITGYRPEVWNAETGKISSVSYRIEGRQTVVPLTLNAEKSVFVVFRKPSKSNGETINEKSYHKVVGLDETWRVTFEKNRGAPLDYKMSRLTALELNSNSGIRYFSGIATYNRTFNSPKSWVRGKPLLIDLGTVYEVAEVWVNGKRACGLWQAPFQCDIGALTRPGINDLSVKVANLWVNRLIGDAQPHASAITFTTMPTYRPDASLRPSGLIGPVTLLMEDH